MKNANQFLSAIDSRILLLALVGIAAVLRIPFMMDDFWLDEIWSLNLAKSIKSFGAIFSELKIDANHILNTVQFYLIGSTSSWISYRAVSFISGMASIFLVYRVALLFGRHQAILATLLSCVCFPLVLYSSEARGYAMSIMFSLLAFISLDNHIKKNSALLVILFWVSSVLAMLSHFSFIYVYAAYFQWSLYRLWTQRKNGLDFLWQCCKLHVAPMAVFIFLYFYFIQQMGVAGANVGSWAHEIHKFVSLMYGLPKSVLLTIPFLILTFAALIWITYSLHNKKSEYWPVFLLIIFVNPVLVILAVGYGYPQMRYFLLLLPFLLIVLSICLVDLYDKATTGRIFYWLFLSIFLTGNIVLDLAFLKYGRGDYLAAMRYLENSSSTKEITVGSDHDYRNFALLEYYAQFLSSSKTLRYISQARLETSPPDWYLVHDLSWSNDVAESVVVGKHGYKLTATFHAYDPDVIGWHWHIYKKLN